MPPAPLSSSEKSAPERINAPFPAHPKLEYAIYLDHCQRHGVTILRGDTSLDLTGRAFGMDFAAEAELRQIYLKARYNGTATAEDAARAAELVRKICS